MTARLVALATAVPPYTVAQEDARDFARDLFRDVLSEDNERLLAIFDHAGIRQRNVCAPLDWYGADHDFAEKNALYVEQAVRLGAEVASTAMAQAGLTVRDIDHLVFVSSTGIAAPSIDARLANVLGLSGDFHRTPIWGLGCAGGVAGLARAREFAVAEPGARVLLIALELCTLTFQRNDLSKRNLVAASLFGDGAAAALVVADEQAAHRNGGPALDLMASASTFWPDTLDVMGWDVDSAGLHVIFARDIPTIVNERVRPGLEEFLARHELSLDRLDHLVSHPGGMKVLAAYQKALGLPPCALDHARAVLRDHGNMSSPTCLFVLERFLAAHTMAAGETAVLSALGPGFCAEYVLARVPEARRAE
jgi:alkylresorcinol/alkylpyrone synthase